MSDFNRIERFLAKKMTKVPFLKTIAKCVYSRLSLLLYGKGNKIISEHKIMQVQLNGQESFWGYYDNSPLQPSRQNLLFHSSAEDTKKLPEDVNFVDICSYNVATQKVMKLVSTSAFNWQQGAKTKWLNDNEFIYNDYCMDRNTYISKIYSLEKNKVVNSFPVAIYDSYKDSFGISISFERLATLRPDYGYFASVNEPLSDEQLDVLHVEFSSKVVRKLFGISELLDMLPLDDKNAEMHKFNHIMIDPLGNSFMFLHRYSVRGVKKHRLIVFDIRSSIFSLISDEGIISHCCWLDAEHILGYMTTNKKEKYVSININTKKIKNYELLDNFGDGHPTSFNAKFIVTDTYPNKERMQKLILLDIKNNNLHMLGEFFAGLSFSGESRCDLHPRLDVSGKYVYFDSVHSGRRHLYFMKNPLLS